VKKLKEKKKKKLIKKKEVKGEVAANPLKGFNEEEWLT
jgi:hypothetical protein